MSIQSLLFAFLTTLPSATPVQASTVAEQAQTLCEFAKSRPEYQEQLQIAQQNGISAQEVDEIANTLCVFYASSTATKLDHWANLLDATVTAGQLTEDDQLALEAALYDPAGTVEAWIPDTNFGEFLLHTYDHVNTDSHASTAGDIGTLAGAMIGGLGGSPATVGLGATIGFLMGEAANTLGNFWYDLAPDDGEGREEGGEEGGDSGGDSGGEDGGDSGGDSGGGE